MTKPIVVYCSNSDLLSTMLSCIDGLAHGGQHGRYPKCRESMKKAAPTLVTETGLKRALAEGFLIEVVCQEEPERRHNAWYGSWIVRAVSQDGTIEILLVTDREGRKDTAELRQFKTAVGLVSFVAGLGLRGVNIPMVPGGRFLQPGPIVQAGPKSEF